MKQETQAPIRRMLSPAKRLQIAVRFATMDMNNLRAGDWLNLRDDVQAFLDGPLFKRALANDFPLHGGDVLVRAMDGNNPYEYSEEAFRKLQSEAHAVLSDMVLGPREGKGAFKPVDVHVRMCTPSFDELVKQGGQNALVIEGTVRDTFLWLLLYLLAQGGTEYITRCPECEKIFYRVRKQAYCSRVCTNRVTVRRWRDKKAPA